MTASPYACAGEIVTCEMGHPVAMVARDIQHGDWPRTDQFSDWRIPEPVDGKPIPRCHCGARWVRPGFGWELHIGGAWR